jgi:hypothetical protein
MVDEITALPGTRLLARISLRISFAVPSIGHIIRGIVMTSPDSSEIRDQQGQGDHSDKALPPPTNSPKRKAEGKDLWDKVSTLSTILSTILIAAVGGYFTHRFEERQAQEQRKIQETQAVAQLMPYLTGTDQQQKRAFVAVKVLGNTKLMVDLAASDPRAPAAREALRDVEFYATTQSDKDSAISVLAQFEFAPSCKLPFENVSFKHPIDFSDQSCGMFGDSPSNDIRLQNSVKNNFCAGADFRDVSLADFVTLQQQADARVGGGSVMKLPSDRGALKNLDNGMGEGSAIRFTGYIMGVRSVGQGESVNCRAPGIEANDLHVDLVNRLDEVDRCQSITAEISPHMRPAKWELANLEPLAEGKVLVRIGGQLMYDASHRPCSEGARVVPQRLSTWEIHPVYSIEVCPTAQKGVCPNGQWVPLAPPPKE